MIVITNGMTEAELISAINTNFAELAIDWGVHANSFTLLTQGMILSDFIEVLNHNFRSDTFEVAINGNELISVLNQKFASIIRRFQDNRIENLWLHGEPSALVSDDGSQMDVWAASKYSYSIDGEVYSEPVALILDSHSPIQAHQVMKDGDTYYMTACNSDFTALYLFSSVNKINWTYISTLMVPGTFGDWTILNIGNTFMWNENGSWKMLIEGNVGGRWKIGLATASAVTGPWTHYSHNPVFEDTRATNNGNPGNPELACKNNKVFKLNGRYYMYLHWGFGHDDNSIKRLWSTDLINWTDEGAILDTRVPPDDPAWSNGDQCIVEFKGRTYLFYTNNANGGGTLTHTDVTMDNRSINEILSLYP